MSKNRRLPAIVVDSVTRRFGAFTAVSHLSFTVQQGEIFGLLGPNGAGKTTCLNLITGMLERHEGTIHVLGFDPEQEAREVRQRIGLVPQDTNVYQDLSAVDNLWHHAALYCDDLSQVKVHIESLLKMMKLWERRKDPVRTYSGGMKRRLALARALLHQPDVIFFDEPTLGVDVQGKHALWDHIKVQRDQGKTFIISTNDMAEADYLCDRLVILDRGTAVVTNTPENLKSNLGRDIVTLRTTPLIQDPDMLFAGMDVEAAAAPEPGSLRLEVNHAEEIVGELVQRVTLAHQLESMRIARPTLDDVFLHHTGRALRE
ncbi:MAG: ATP-binding cassette domain-containing protein [Chloroflexi bacterium]|nr:MAG: ATP-binding cassette domain-containing protein [Chloroflexota bacterium]